MRVSAPTVVDLFAGAGGLSYGFKQAGLDVVWAAEVDAWAAETFETNHPETPLSCVDLQH